MSIDQSIYIGAYIEAQNEKVETDIIKKRCCDNIYQDKDLFCKYCGSELQFTKVDTLISDKYNHYEVFSNKMNDDLCFIHNEFMPEKQQDRNVDLFISNFKDVIGVYLNARGVIEITDNVITETIRKFLVKFQDHIILLKKYYGKDKVSVKFGTIVYYS